MGRRSVRGALSGQGYPQSRLVRLEVSENGLAASEASATAALSLPGFRGNAPVRIT